MPRIRDDAGNELIGYVDRWSAAPGETIRLMVSSSAPQVQARLVRLRHGDPNPEGPGYRATPVGSAADGTYPGRVQPLQAGSRARIDDDGRCRTLGVWVWPTRPAAGREQLLVQRGDVAIVLDPDGCVRLRRGDVELVGGVLERERWVRVVAVAGVDRLTLAVADRLEHAPAGGGELSGPILLAGDAEGQRCFEGRLEEPFCAERALAAPELADELAPDRRFDLREGTLVNAPATAVTGRRWQDDTTDFRSAPDEYAAVHFHSDDLEDAGWEPMLSFAVPGDLASGVYAFELAAGGLRDEVPFVVRPARGAPRAQIGFLLPTLTYQVYGNERLIAGGERSMAPMPVGKVQLDPADEWLAAHPGAGASCYDRHPDGDGVTLVSQLRPIPNVRPSFVWWVTGAPERFGSDLYIVDWLDELAEPYDVFTDHDLHADGRALLDGYRVIVTGTHPEYCSREMLEALAAYLAAGGRLMYLGGNGFYWVTSIDPARPQLAEVRRGVNGTRAWSSRPGELRHQTTGEQGGLWRYRGRDPNRLVGVGFASQSDAPDTAPGFRRSAASYEDELSWIFDGVDGDTFGEHGLYLGGAAGYEIDRHDPEHGSPPEAVVVATSAGLHPPSYLLVVEDMDVTIPAISGPDCELVRADVTYLPYPDGGAVFSVGSCSWAGSLSTNGYDNGVARISANVLRRFLA